MRKHPLKRWLEEHGLTAKDFAEQLLVAPSTITRAINGEVTPNSLLRRRIAKATRNAVTAEELARWPLAA